MDPIKPVEGILKDAEGQASVLGQLVRERYWQQQAQPLPAVEAADETTAVTKKHQGQVEEKSQDQKRHSYAEFEINRETREVTVRIIEAESGKLLRTIPPDELAKEIIKGNFQPNQLRRRAVIV
jgi:uncharacterized FlaG/YvyC family protein